MFSNSRRPSAVLALLLAPSLVLAQAPAASMQRIGAAAAVKGSVKVQNVGAKVGTLVASGKPIYLNDHVTTGADSRLQVMLLDQTVFTLGPGSDMVLDEFVYDPNTSAGKVTANVLKGTFRFVSGKIAHDSGENMKIKVPAGTMGIRGTIAAGAVDGGNATLVLLGPGANNNAGEAPGAIAITGSGGGSVLIDQPGYGSTLTPGQPPTPPVEMKAQIGQIMGQVGTTSGGSASSGGSSGGGSSSSGPQGPSNPSGAAGQETAAGGTSANVAVTQQVNSDNAALATTAASQDFTRATGGITDGVSTWEQVGTITTGQDYYSMSGTYSCSGGSCSTGVSGTASMSLVIDYGARTVGGTGSYSQVVLNASGGFAGDSASILSQSWGTSGPAVIHVTNFSGGTGNFAGTTVSLQNAAGVIARDAIGSISYTGSSSESASGSVSGTKQPLPPQ